MKEETLGRDTAEATLERPGRFTKWGIRRLLLGLTSQVQRGYS